MLKFYYSYPNSISNFHRKMSMKTQRCPVLSEVDVIVAGGTTWAVAAALSARKTGATVFLVTDKTYLGDDLCATLRLGLADGQVPKTDLARALFPNVNRSATPLHIKKTLDKALLDAGVKFLFQSYPTEVLKDEEGFPRGIVIDNRAGSQVILGKTIVDATPLGHCAGIAGAEKYPQPDGPVDFGFNRILPGKNARPNRVTDKFKSKLSGLDHPELCEIQNIARDKFFTKGQLRSAESVFFVPPAPVRCKLGSQDWDPQTEIRIDHFRPSALPRFYVVGGAADIPRDVARELLQPAGFIALAGKIGSNAAAEALNLDEKTSPPLNIVHAGKKLKTHECDEFSELRQALRPAAGDACQCIELSMEKVETKHEYDIVVVGGGTAGSAAAISAAREGHNVLVVEYQEGPGGMGTVGMIANPYHGLNIGFATEVPFPGDCDDPDVNTEYKMEWIRRELHHAGGEMWNGCLCVGALCEQDVVNGVYVAAPDGRHIVKAKVVIDASGSADAAVFAGADYIHGAEEDGDIAMQGVGLPTRPLDKSYVNSDYLLTDDTDPLDMWFSLVGARLAMADEFDVGPLVQSRERRRVVGRHTLEYLDQILGRTYPDSIVLSCSDYDSHGYPNDTFFHLLPHDDETRRRNHPAPGGMCYTPYRCLLPAAFEGILVVGLGISMKRDAASMVRMQYDMLNQGYAAGLAAGMAVSQEIQPSEIDIKSLQRKLIDKGTLPPEVHEHDDNFPLPESIVEDAVMCLLNISVPESPLLKQNPVIAEAPADIRNIWLKRHGKYRNPQYDTRSRALAVVMAHGRDALPQLRKAYEFAEGDAKLYCAQIMCILGEPTGIDALVDKLRDFSWDKKILQGRMAEYAHLPTPVDALVLALGMSKDSRAFPVLLEKMEELDADTTLSHHRSMAMALKVMGRKEAAKPLAALLKKTGMSGHVIKSVVPLYNQPAENRSREASLRELVLARALLHCGDYKGIGMAILNEYKDDMRAVLARHAAAVLHISEG